MNSVKFLFNETQSASRRTSVFDVLTADDAYLGQIKYLSHFRQYCFMPTCSIALTKEQVDDISARISWLSVLAEAN